MEILNFLFVINLSPEYLSVVGTLLVPVILFIIVTFLLRLNGENIFRNSSTITRINKCLETPVIKIENPYCIKLISSEINQCSSNNDKVQLRFTFLQPCKVTLFWHVHISKFYQHLELPWQNLIQEVIVGTMISERKLALSQSDCEDYDACQNLSKLYDIPDVVKRDELGSPPRQRYPLIIVTMVQGDNCEINPDSPSVVMMFTIIHLKDEVCQLNSHVICQYIKTSDDNISCLQPLFVSSSDSNKVSNSEHHHHQQNEDVNSSSGNVTPYTSNDEVPTNTRFNSHRNFDASCSFNSFDDCPVSQDDKAVRESDVNSPVDTECVRTSALDNDDEECVVCQSTSVTTALLPCRHACVCDICLSKIDKCPMCRGIFVSYFTLKKCNENVSQDENETQQPAHHEIQNWWGNLNTRLNNYLGFT